MADVLPVIIDLEPIENTENLDNNVKPLDDEVFSDEELSEEMEEPVKVEVRPKIDNKIIFFMTGPYQKSIKTNVNG